MGKNKIEEIIPKNINIVISIIKIGGWFYIVGGSLLGLSSIIWGIIFISIKNEEAIKNGILLLLVGILLFIISIILGIISLKSIAAIFDRKKWAREFGIIFGIILLPLYFPIGAIAGVKILITLFSIEGENWFIS